MAAEPTEGSYLHDLSFFLTFRCQIACPHCFARAGPHRTEVMTERDGLDWIGQAARYDGLRIKAIDFTGGEPFLELGLLRRLVAFAETQGLITTCVTNAAWAETPRIAHEVLRTLPGLSALEVSADTHHLERIPFARVEHVLGAASERGMVVSVSVCTEDERSPDHLALVDRLRALVSLDQIRVTITRPLGRALTQLGRRGDHGPRARVPRERCGVDGPYVLPDGRVIACVAALELSGETPLFLGDLRKQPLAEILTGAERSYAIHYLRLFGPAALRDDLVQHGFDCELERAEASSDPCALCRHLMSRTRIGDGLGALSGDPERMGLLASARLFHLGEAAMVRWLGLDEDESAAQGSVENEP